MYCKIKSEMWVVLKVNRLSKKVGFSRDKVAIFFANQMGML